MRVQIKEKKTIFEKKILARFFLADQIFEGVQQKKKLQGPFSSQSVAFSMVELLSVIRS
jgi:hypothetical protein